MKNLMTALLFITCNIILIGIVNAEGKCEIVQWDVEQFTDDNIRIYGATKNCPAKGKLVFQLWEPKEDGKDRLIDTDSTYLDAIGSFETFVQGRLGESVSIRYAVE